MVVIRRAILADADEIVDLLRALAIYEKEPLSSVKLTAADVRRDGFGPARRFEVLLAEEDGRALGFALTFYSTVALALITLVGLILRIVNV